MSRYTVACCMALALALASGALGMQSVPVLLWGAAPSSGSSINSVTELGSLLHAQSPRLTVAFVISKVHGSQLLRELGAFAPDASTSLSSVQRAYQAAQSAHFQAHAAADSSVATQLQQYATAKQYPMFAGSAENCVSVLAHLREQRSGVVTVALEGEQLQAQSTCVKRVLAALEGTPYVGIVSSAVSSDLASSPHAGPAFAELSNTLMATTNSTSRAAGVQYISGPILFGLIYAFVLIFTLYVGVSVMAGIQTPLRFPGRKMPVNKEF